MITIRSATREDAIFVADHLRTMDADECVLMGLTPRDAVLLSLDQSAMSWVMLVDSVPAAIAGCVRSDLVGGHGIPWLLTTPLVEQHKLSFVKAVRQWLKECLVSCTRLENYVDARYTKAMRLLNSLGFTVDAGTAWRLFWMEA